MKARLAKLTVLAGALSALVSGHTAALGLTGRGKTCGS